MIVKNEEKVLNKCLSSLMNIADEIIIVDTGSSDKTISIAVSFGAKVYSFNWGNNFAEARNFALSKCIFDWILYIDADEYLADNSSKVLSAIKNSIADKAFYCIIENEDDVNGRPSVMLYPRLFPNNKNVRFKGAVHEQIESSLSDNNIPVLSSEIKLIHTGYNLNTDDKKTKAERNLKILLIDYKQHPDSYKAFQIAQSYGILENKNLAEEYFNLSLKKNDMRSEYQALACRYIGLNLAEKNNYPEAEFFLLKSLTKDSNQPLTLLGLSELYRKLRDYNKAIQYCKEAFSINLKFIEGKLNSFQTIYLSLDFFYFYIIELSLISNNPAPLFFFIDNAAENTKKLLVFINRLLMNTCNNDDLKILLNNHFYSNIPLHLALGKHFNETGNYKEAEYFLSYSINQGTTEASAFLYLISVLLNTGKPAEALIIANKGYQLNVNNQPLANIFNKIINQINSSC